MTSLSGRFIFRVCNSKFTKVLIDQIVFIKFKFVIYRKRMRVVGLFELDIFCFMPQISLYNELVIQI